MLLQLSTLFTLLFFFHFYFVFWLFYIVYAVCCEWWAFICGIHHKIFIHFPISFQSVAVAATSKNKIKKKKTCFATVLLNWSNELGLEKYYALRSPDKMLNFNKFSKMCQMNYHNLFRTFRKIYEQPFRS